VHFETYAVHSPTNALFINLVKNLKFTLKYTIISLLHVSVFNDHHQGVISVPDYSYIYVKTLSKITSSYKLGDVAACRKAACVLCAVQSETKSRILTLHCKWHRTFKTNVKVYFPLIVHSGGITCKLIFISSLSFICWH